MSNLFQTLIHSNTINFLIVLSLLLFLMSKLKIGNKIDLMRNEIKNFVDESTNEKNLAEKELENINNKIKNLPKETQEIETSAQKNIEGFERRIENELKDKMLDIKTSSDRILNLEIKQFKAKLTGLLSEASINLAKKNAIEQLENNRELHNKYIYEAIDEIDGINL